MLETSSVEVLLLEILMPAIEWVTVEGFRSIRAIKHLDLTDINVIIGANGSGKSNFIALFSFLNAIREGRLKEYVARMGGANALFFLGSKETKQVHIRLAFSGEVNGYEIALGLGSHDDLIPLYERGYYWDKLQHPTPYDRAITGRNGEAGISSPSSDSITKYVQGHLDRWRLYHFHDTSVSSPLKATCDVADNRYLRYDGANLPAYLNMLKSNFPNNYKLIVNAVKRAAPFFSDFILEPLALNPEKIRLEWRHVGTDSYFNASMLSDGTLRFIALSTLLLQPALLRPSVILIDEPELGLHPYALTLLASMVKQASQLTQIILSTQSALLLDHFDPNQVLVADRLDNGTILKRLTNDSLDGWLQEYSLGQLWEKAEFGGRPGDMNVPG